MLESLFGNPVIEKVLFFLIANEKCYPSQLREAFQTPLYSFQRALGLEKGDRHYPCRRCLRSEGVLPRTFYGLSRNSTLPDDRS